MIRIQKKTFFSDYFVTNARNVDQINEQTFTNRTLKDREVERTMNREEHLPMLDGNEVEIRQLNRWPNGVVRFHHRGKILK